MRSNTGNIKCLKCGPICWTSQHQKLQALSAAEAEVYSATEAIKDAAQLLLLLSELGIRGEEPIPIHEDNSACIKMSAQRFKVFNKARHYVQRVNFLQERVADGTAEFEITPTDMEIADALTKPLTAQKFLVFRDMMMTHVSATMD